MLERSDRQVKGRSQRRISPLFMTAVALFLLLVIGFATVVSHLSRATDTLMRREAKALNILAENLVPSHDNLRFSSLDKNATLAGWFFRARGAVRGNIIIVHDNLNNRLQFDLETADLYKFLTQSGFNVLAFDLRHSGQSTGEISAYGYLEYLDVLAAIRELERLSSSDRHVILAFGSGCAASLLAWQQLPEQAVPEHEREALVKDLNSSQENIRGMIFDTITASPDDYIRADLSQIGWLNKWLYYPWIPTTVRLSAGHERLNLSPLLAQVRAPVMITRNLPDSSHDEREIEAVISERLRLKSELTVVWETPVAGSVSGFLDDRENYKEQLTRFFDRWLPATNQD